MKPIYRVVTVLTMMLLVLGISYQSVRASTTTTILLGDRVWRDTNANGVQDAGEPGIANVTVRLADCSGNTLATTYTDANGIYSFVVTAGSFEMTFVTPASGYTGFSPQYAQGAAANYTNNSDSNPNASGGGGSNFTGSWSSPGKATCQ